jgi:pimeloyl-ACP methyl ester carboxylesterase
LSQSIDTIADDVVKVMDELKVSKAVLVGHSMGATTALQLAAKHGDKVIAVVAIGPVHPTASTGQVFEKRIQIVSEGMYFASYFFSLNKG